MNAPLVSIIIPVYNMGRYVERCIESVCNQTYDNLEIILVNDASTDNSLQIMEKWDMFDSRVRIVSHEMNQGLFQARLTGVKAANGEYIAFVDSDDHISRDWIRQLVVCAEENECDLVAGDFCIDYGNNNLQCITLDPLRIKEWDLKGREVFEEFLKQSGQMFSWHVVWNKLYRKKLWARNGNELQEYSNMHGHMIMWEDVAFSSVIWSSAQRFMNVHGAFYFYNKENERSATNTVVNNSIDPDKRNKYIYDVKGAMGCFKKRVDNWIYRYNADACRISSLYDAWYDRMFFILYTELVLNGSRQFERELREKLDYQREIKPIDDYFGRLQTPLSKQFWILEDGIKTISDRKTEVVSFDVFDTLVMRMVLEPTDIFEILSNELNSKYGLACIDFAALRKNAERRCRELVRVNHLTYEEITLDEIYQTLSKGCVIEQRILDWAKEREQELEIEFCVQRRTGKVLYDLARQCGKRIIICSDMYLPVNTIKRILDSNGFSDYEEAFISSCYRLTKATGSLYKEVQRRLRISAPQAIIHIGDNYDSDIVQSKKNGWNALHISKASDLLLNKNPEVYTGNALQNAIWRNLRCVDLRVYEQFLSIRCIMGLMAKQCFDFPVVSTNMESDYDASPERIGYMALGPHLIALCDWIGKIALKESIPTIHFVARDGYVVKQAFDILNQNEKVKTNYIRLSRKALVLADVQKVEDLYSLITKCNLWNLSAGKLASYLDPLIPAARKGQLEEVFENRGIKYRKTFEGVERFNEAIKVYIDEVLDFSLLEEYKEKLRGYFGRTIKPGDYIFDIGYSGRPESALSALLGFSVGSLYIHTNNDYAMRRQNKYGCKCYCFYNHKPIITGLLREHMLMELGPSTVGFREVEGEIQPILDEYSFDYATVLITKLVQAYALKFVEDFKTTFGKYIVMMDIRPDDASVWLEDYLHNSKMFDGELFRCVVFEDDIGAGKAISIVDAWRSEIRDGCPIQIKNADNSIVPLHDIYMDGYFVKAYRMINKWFPKGGRKRELIKRIAGIFIH